MAGAVDNVIRGDLLGQLPRAEDRVLVVLSAPAGWGKSTVLATWAATRPDTTFCTLALTPADNDPRRFQDRLLTAVEEAAGRLQWGPGAESSPAVWAEEILPRAARHLSEAGPVVLAFDDYHEISRPEIHQIVQALIDDLPPDMSVALSTRVDPPLRLARLRAARRVVEWRAADLAFSDHDAGRLTVESYGLELDREVLGLLVAKTEGWPAAISLASSSLLAIDEPRAFVDHFLATDQYLVDYLTEELTATLGHLRPFLTATAVVDAFTPDLAAHLVDLGGDAPWEELERRGVLQRWLEAGEQWFRYHQLVRDHLYLQASPTDRATAHRRAAAWFDERGAATEAIDHLIRGGAEQEAADLIVANASAYILRGRSATVLHWLDAIADTTDLPTRLALIGAQAAFYDGRRGRARRWLDQTARPQPSEPAEQLVELMLRCMLTNADGQIADAAVWATRIEAMLDGHSDEPTITDDERAEGHFIASTTYAYAGDLPAAWAALDRSLAIAVGPGGGLVPAVAGLGFQAFLRYLEGDEAASRQSVEEALAAAEALELPSNSLHLRPASIMVLLVGEPDLGDELVADPHRFELSYSPYGMAIAHVAEAIHYARTGRPDESDEAMLTARELLDEVEQPSSTIERLYRTVTADLPRGPAERPDPGSLTAREREVLRLLATDLTQRQIAGELFLSFNTVKTYTRSSYRKLGVSGRAEAVTRCRRLGLL
ncbi:MAG: LuxR C-terminal-related transcriptional regulator [Actinomycetota bacterium]